MLMKWRLMELISRKRRGSEEHLLGEGGEEISEVRTMMRNAFIIISAAEALRKGSTGEDVRVMKMNP